MSDTVVTEPTGPTHKNILWGCSALFVLAATMVWTLVLGGDPKNDLHLKALDGAINLIWLDAAVFTGTALAAFLAVFKK